MCQQVAPIEIYVEKQQQLMNFICSKNNNNHNIYICVCIHTEN